MMWICPVSLHWKVSISYHHSSLRVQTVIMTCAHCTAEDSMKCKDKRTEDSQGTAVGADSDHHGHLLPQPHFLNERLKKTRSPAQPLTVSHLALARSSSNLANSFRSWMVMSSFQMSSVARPMSRMAPITESRTTRMSGPLGHSGRQRQRAGVTRHG